MSREVHVQVLREAGGAIPPAYSTLRAVLFMAVGASLPGHATVEEKPHTDHWDYS